MARSTVSLVLLGASMLACAPPPGSGEPGGADDVGVVVLELEKIPLDAKCLRLTSTSAGGRVVTRTKDMVLGAGSYTSTFAGLPAGEVTLIGDMYNAACSAVTSTTLVSWVSDAVVAQLQETVKTMVRMTLRRPATASVRLDFFDCATRIEDEWTYPLTEQSTPWRQTWGDPRVEGKQLVLTRDDVLARVPPFLGDSYYFTVDLDFRQPVDFYPQFDRYAADAAPNHPAIRFSQGVMKLGGERYGRDFGTFGNFTGQTIAGGKGIATIFVKGATGEIAMHVKTDATAVKSGFQRMVPPMGAGLLLVGGNAGPPEVMNGDVRLSTLRGCQGLTAAQVQSAYDAY
jgi:hypothetical protein